MDPPAWQRPPLPSVVQCVLCTTKYSEQKNLFPRGQILLVGHIIAHRTKLNPWEFVATKVDITSFVVPNIKHVASIVNLILTLGWDPLGESVFLQVGGFAVIAPYCCLCPSGHAPHQLSLTLLCYSILSTFICPQGSCIPAGGTHLYQTAF